MEDSVDTCGGFVGTDLATRGESAWPFGQRAGIIKGTNTFPDFSLDGLHGCEADPCLKLA